MANSFDSNFTRQLARIFLDKFESARVLSKNVDTQLLAGRFDPASGTIVDFKRPTDYTSRRTSDGDVSSGAGLSDIITGKASGIVQDYFTVFVEYQEADEAIKMDQIDQLLAPMATRIATDMELDFARFMMENSGLSAGTVGTAVTSWDHVAEAGAIMDSSGIPGDSPWMYSFNPFTQTSLASAQQQLQAGGSAGELISDAHRRAVVSENFAGMKVMKATTLASITTFSDVDRAGTLTSAPNATYLAAKDTMTQTLAVTAFGPNMEVRAGDRVEIANVNRLNLNTREVMLDGGGAVVPWSGVVTTAVTLGASGEGDIIVSGPAIFESDGQYNTVDAAPANSAIVTLLGANSTILQPNLFWHKQAFSIGSVPILKLQSTDTLATTEDGLQIRVSKGSDFLANKQLVRFDLRPAYGVMNPFFAGHGWG